MHFEQIKHCVIPYSLSPITTPGGQASLLPSQLASYHIRPLGLTSGSGLLTGVDIHSIPERGTVSTNQPTSTGSGRGGTEAIDKRCHTEGGSLPRTVPQQTFLDTQEGRILSACSEPEAIESVHRQGSLQDGRDQHGEGSVVGERLDGIHRFERRVPFSGGGGRAQKVPPFCVERTDIRVSMPSIWVDQCTEGVHQALEASSGSPQAAWGSPGDFLGRHASSCPVKGGSSSADGPNSPVLQFVGVCGQSGKVTVDPCAGDSISGVYDRLSEVEDPAYAGENREAHRDLQEHQSSK